MYVCMDDENMRVDHRTEKHKRDNSIRRGRDTPDAIFSLRQVKEKYRLKHKGMRKVLIELEKKKIDCFARKCADAYQGRKC